MSGKTTEIREQNWVAPLAANPTSLLSAHSLDGSTVTSFVAQPDVARNLQLVASGSTTSSVTVNGTDILGAVIQETISLNGTTPVYTQHAFANITSVVLPTVGSTTVNIGIYTALGLDNYCDENSISLADNQKKPHQQTWAAPVAASATYVHAAISTAVLVSTGITNPDYARVLSVTGAGSGHTASGNVVINGTDILGNTIIDTIVLNGSSTVNGVKAFKTVTSIDTTGVTGIDTNDTVEVGVAAALGLDSYADAYSFMGFSAETSFTNDPAIISKNTVTTTTAPNGSANIGVVYMPALNPNGVGVSSYTHNATVISLNTITLKDQLNGTNDQTVNYLPGTFAASGRIWG